MFKPKTLPRSFFDHCLAEMRRAFAAYEATGEGTIVSVGSLAFTVQTEPGTDPETRGRFSMPNDDVAQLVALAYAGGAADALRYQSEQIRFQAGLPSIFDGDDAEEDAEDGA